MIELINNQERPVLLVETVGSKYQQKEFSSFKALEKALQIAGISNKVRYPLLKYGKVHSIMPDGTKISLEIKYPAIEQQPDAAIETQLEETKEGAQEG